MKRILFLVVALVAAFSVMAQEKHKVYCELVGSATAVLSKKVTVTVDFGQSSKFWNGGSDQTLVDENGDRIKFNSMVDAMNFMGRLGWVFEQAYVVTTSSQNVYHWLLSKDVVDDSEIMKGFQTKKTYNEQEQEDEPESRPKKKKKVRDDVYM